MAISKHVLDDLLGDCAPFALNEVFIKAGLLDDLKNALSERIPDSEPDERLENERGSGKMNRGNGASPKTVRTDRSKVPLDIPRDRAGTFDPQPIAKYQRRFPGFEEKIISIYARGMTVREI